MDLSLENLREFWGMRRPTAPQAQILTPSVQLSYPLVIFDMQPHQIRHQCCCQRDHPTQQGAGDNG
jgi:hypothetical protein